MTFFISVHCVVAYYAERKAEVVAVRACLRSAFGDGSHTLARPAVLSLRPFVTCTPGLAAHSVESVSCTLAIGDS